MGLFGSKVQTDKNIKLIKRYRYERNKGKDGDDYIGESWDNITVTDVYSVDGKLYAVNTYIRY